MQQWIPFMPEDASTLSGRVDNFYFFLVGLSVFFFTLIAGLEIYFALKYRRQRPDEIPRPVRSAVRLEVVWIVIPFILSMTIFAWGASIYFSMYRMPKDALEIYVVGKQWMWKLQHMEGQREINELHVPVGRKVKLIITTEDVIHSFYVPAFRVKVDAVPGRYTYLWFEATKPGRYHLYCAEYCGTNHSGMIGWVYAMEPADYQAWLGGGAPEESLADSGEKLFQQLACNNCHRAGARDRGPVLDGLFGNPVALDNGQTVLADESYLRESILNSQAKIVAGFQRPSLMPTFQGQISEEQLLQLIAYIKSLSPQAGAGGASPAASPSPPGGSSGTNSQQGNNK
ncbi:MAG: cytochrome c oxidase subunit II [Blastocatellia bacterium]|nr:cytochrome c oxidase subunit II [Blastocatellia bacterium]